MKTNKEIAQAIEHIIQFYTFDLEPYNKAYRVWFQHGLYGEIVLDFLQKLRMPTKIRIIKTSTRTKNEPDRVGYISGINIRNPISFMSQDFKKQRFEIYIDHSRYKSFEKFIHTLIHELAHLVLHSTINKYRMSEVATDLFVMAFGLYEEVHHVGQGLADTPGYISRQQIMFARDYIVQKRKIAKSRGILKLYYETKLWLKTKAFYLHIYFK